MWEVLTDRTVALLQNQRHSFVNHLQVVSGWLQLNRTDRARGYLEMVAARMIAEAELVRSLPPVVGVVVMTLGLEAESLGARLEWRLKGPISEVADRRAERLYVQVSEALRRLSERPEGERFLRVTIGRDGLPSVHTPEPDETG